MDVSVHGKIREYTTVLLSEGDILLILTQAIRFFFFLLHSAIGLTYFQDVVRMLKELLRLSVWCFTTFQTV